MNSNTLKIMADFMNELSTLDTGDSLEVQLEDGNKWFFMNLKKIRTAIAPYLIFSPEANEPIIGSDVSVDVYGLEFFDRNQSRGFYWGDVKTMVVKRGWRA